MVSKNLKHPHIAFTINYNSIVREIFSFATISNFFNSSYDFRTKKALWDTGASGSAINTTLVDKLKLSPVDTQIMQSAHGKSEVKIYLVNLVLPNRCRFKGIPVSGSNLGNRVDILIGMDVIQVGDFAISNAQGKTTFTYCNPPFDNKIDFVKKAESLNPKILRKNERLKRKNKKH